MNASIELSRHRQIVRLMQSMNFCQTKLLHRTTKNNAQIYINTSQISHSVGFQIGPDRILIADEKVKSTQCSKFCPFMQSVSEKLQFDLLLSGVWEFKVHYRFCGLFVPFQFHTTRKQRLLDIPLLCSTYIRCAALIIQFASHFITIDTSGTFEMKQIWLTRFVQKLESRRL